MTDHCSKENQLGKMEGSIAKLEKEIFGNHKKGMSQTVTEICVEMKGLKDMNLRSGVYRR